MFLMSSNYAKVLLFLLPVAIAANMPSPTNVVINEIAWMGDVNNWRNEWIEIYNNSGQKVDLNGWSLQVDSKITPHNGNIGPFSFFILAKNDNTIHDNLLKGSLNNNGGTIILRDNIGRIADRVDFVQGWPAGDNLSKRTMERKGPELSGSGKSNWQTSARPHGTIGSKNSLSSLYSQFISRADILVEDNGKQNNRSFIGFVGIGALCSLSLATAGAYLNFRIKQYNINNLKD